MGKTCSLRSNHPFVSPILALDQPTGRLAFFSDSNGNPTAAIDPFLGIFLLPTILCPVLQYRGILFVQTPDPLTAEVRAHRFHTTIMRTIHNLQLALESVPIQDVQFQSRR